MAIDELLDEHEQSERVQAWLRDNATGLIGGIALGLAAIGGWKWWEQHQASQQLEIAGQYQQAVAAIEKKDAQAPARIQALDPGLYRSLAALELAASQASSGQAEAAIATLRGIRIKDDALMSIVNERLARLLIETKKADEALKLASGDSASALEVRGDALYALGKRDEARESYSKALTKLDVAAPNRRMLELKLVEVGGTPPSTEIQS